MNEKIAMITITTMILISIGSATMSMNMGMTSGSDSFTDSWSTAGNVVGQGQYSMQNGAMSGQNLFTIGPNSGTFNENTIANYLKGSSLSDDPYINVAKSISNTGSGVATSGMIFSDTRTSVSLFSGMQTDKNVNSASMSMYATDLMTQFMTGSFNMDHEALTAEASQMFDRSTWKLTHKFDVALI